MELVDSLVSVPSYWNKSKTTSIISKVLLVIFVLYVLSVGIWQHVVFATSRDTETNVYQSSRNLGVQHFFKLSCHDPLGCIVGTRLQRNDENYFPPNNPNDPCNTFNTQFYRMKDGDAITAAICYVSDRDNGVAVLVHDGGSVRAESSSDEDESISDDTDWDDTFGYQTMISMTPITVSNSINGNTHDDWIIVEREDLSFPLTGDFFRCATPSQCGCNTTFFNQTDTNCEAFIFRLDEVGYTYRVYRPFSYLVILSQIVALSILGYVILRMVLAVVFRIEKRLDGDPLPVQQQEYSQLES
jgi:hypothetical protein